MWIALPLLLAPLAPQAPEVQESILRVYDVAPLLTSVDDGLTHAVVSPPVSYSSDMKFARAPDTDRTNAAAVLDAVYQLLEPELAYADRGVYLVGEDRLAARLPEPLQADLAAALEFLGDALRRTRTLHVRRYEFGANAADLATGAFGPDAWTALRDSLGAPTDAVTVALPTGATGLVDLRESRSFVEDYDIEIASSSVAYDPVVAQALVGWRVAAHAASGEGGTWLAFCGEYGEAPRPVRRGSPSFGGVIAVAEPGPTGPSAPGPGAPRRIEREGEFDRWFESIEVLQRVLAFQAFVPEGGGLALRMSGALPAGTVDELWTLEVTGGGPRVASFESTAAGRRITLVDPGAAARPGVEWAGERNPLHRAPVDDLFSASIAARSPGILQDLLPGRARDWAALGGFLFQVGDDAKVPAQARAVLDPLCAPPASSAAVAVRAVGADGTAARVELPLGSGSRAAAWLAQYQWLVGDADVEVANYASGREGVSFVVAEGLFATAAGDPRGEAWDLDVVATAQRRARDWRTYLLLDPHGGSLELSDLAFAAVAGRFLVGTGEAVDLTGSGALTARLLPAR